MSVLEEPEEHPSFAVAIVTRTSSSPGAAMFQSDLLHRDYISLSIETAARYRDLSHDWVHPRKQLLELRMSLAQWGSLVSSIGIGSGVPVTLVRVAGEDHIEEPPHQPRMKVGLEEVNGSVAKMMDKAYGTLDALTDAIENKRGAKAVRDALRNHTASIEHASANSKFVIDSLAETAERVVSHARADIESSILAAVSLTGGQPIEAPELTDLSPRGELE